MSSSLTLQRALLGTVVLAIVAGLVPAAIVLDRRLAVELEDRARTDLALAPRVLADRMTANSDAMMMHAKELASAPRLDAALAAGDHDAARAILEAARATLGGEPVLVGPSGEQWAGPAVDSALVARTRAGEMPVVVRPTGTGVSYVAIAPVKHNDHWIGAAGLAAPIDDRLAGTLSGLTRSGVVLISDSLGPIVSTLDSVVTRQLSIAMRARPSLLGAAPTDVSFAGRRFLVVGAPLPGAGTIVFTRALDEELAILPRLRGVSATAAVAALLFAALLGGLLAARVARPVRQLAASATALADGDFAAPLPESRIHEVERVASAFDEMRRVLALRLAELRDANAALTDRNARLTALQSDLMQRERLAATGRLVVQLAHEIRNPVASLRNCLELIRRRVGDDAEALQFADLAIDELLRMHELAEQMLELHRPRGTANVSRPVPLSRDVARLESLGAGGANPMTVTISGDETASAAIAPDALKQVLLNLLQNAREAAGPERSTVVTIDVRAHGPNVQIDVRDSGPGLPADILPRIFDPFFTTKSATRGVGLGLYVADGLVRATGGRIVARDGGGVNGASGAWFHVELPSAAP